jgi:hypothetical protein
MKSMKLMALTMLSGLTAGMVLAADQMPSAPAVPEAGTPHTTTPSTHSRAEVKSELVTAIKAKARPTSAESEDVPMASAKSMRSRFEVKSEVSAANKAGKHPQIGD